MRLFAIVPVALCNMGCALGWGSAYVGEWLPRRELDYRACLEDAQGRCIQKREKVTNVPARSFVGVMFPSPAALGGSIVNYNGKTSTKFRTESNLEVLRGRGPWAYGVRLGVAVDDPISKLPMVMVPVTLQGHYAFTDNFNVYAGGGWVPVSIQAKEVSHVGAMGHLGARWSFANAFRQTFYFLAFEANTAWVALEQPYLSTGMTGCIGASF